MANEIRLRANNISGAINDNPLLIGATTINSPHFADLPVVDATNHLIIALDPLEVHGAAEIVVVTAHTVAATSVTVIRGQEGSVARQHPLATTWFHGPVGSDWNYTQRTALSTNRPASPFNGELIYETDTNSLVARSSAGPSWQTVVPLGAYAVWTPTLTNITVGAGVVIARYAQVGKTVFFSWSFSWGAGSSFTGEPRFSPPVAINAALVGREMSVGSTNILDSGSQIIGGYASITGTNEILLRYWDASVAFLRFGLISNTAPITWANGDCINVIGHYEAA